MECRRIIIIKKMWRGMMVVFSTFSMVVILFNFLLIQLTFCDAFSAFGIKGYVSFCSTPCFTTRLHRIALSPSRSSTIQFQNTKLPQDEGCCDQQVPGPEISQATTVVAANTDDDEKSVVAPSDPLYIVLGPIGLGDFIVSREGPPTKEELTNENMLKIVLLECTDLEVNTLVWKCLGYRFDPQQLIWTNEECFPKWIEKHPMPPDFIGMQRIYSKEIDQPSLKSNQDITRSIPMEHKQMLKKHLLPLGFRGYTMDGLTPNKTRRAQCTNWLLFFREELFGYTIEELKKRRQLKQQLEEKQIEEEKRNQATAGDENVAEKPPINEVF